MYLGQGKYGSRALPTIVFTLSQDRDGSFTLFFSNDLPRLNLIEAPLFVIPFVDDLDYLQTISDRIYLEEAGYWGLVALREREKEKEYAIGNVNNEKYFG